MNTWTRRDLLRASAGAAVAAVPMAALRDPRAAAAADDDDRDLHEFAGDEPVMFCVHDVQHGEVSILHGSDEVVVHDRRLVARILRAAKTSRSGDVVSS